MLIFKRIVHKLASKIDSNPSNNILLHFDKRIVRPKSHFYDYARDLKCEPRVDFAVRFKRHVIFVPGNDSIPQGLRLQTT